MTQKQNFGTSKILVFVLLVLTSILLISGMGIISDLSFATNITDDTTIISFNITNSEPQIYDIRFGNDSVVLTPGNITIVNCTAYIFDYNGFNDTFNASGAIWDDDVANYGDATDNNNYYYNSSCDINSTIPNSNNRNGTITCFFGVEYYANNGTNWHCNLTITDLGNLSGSRNESFVIEELLAIQTPDTASYGNVTVNQIKNLTINVTNIGNIDVNLSVRGYGGGNLSEGANTSFNCQLGNITDYYHRFNRSQGNWNDMMNVSANYSSFTGFNLSQRTDDNANGNSENTTFWSVYIPFGVGGFCNGTVEFLASSIEGQ